MTQYYIGTSGWHYDDWRCRFYPEKLPKDRWLEFYARHFNTLELNNPFYHLPTEATFRKWHDTSPEDFVFSVKVSRFITHIKRLQDCQEAVDKFVTRATLLKNKLGPLLYQLPPGLKRDDDRLKTFLVALPAGLKHVVEFRHESWFSEEIYGILRKYHIAFCAFDMPGLTSPVIATADFAYVRFHGSGRLYSGRYRDEDLSEWAEKMAKLTKNVKEVYVYFNNDIGGAAIDNAKTIRDYIEGGLRPSSTPFINIP